VTDTEEAVPGDESAGEDTSPQLLLNVEHLGALIFKKYDWTLITCDKIGCHQ